MTDDTTIDNVGKVGAIVWDDELLSSSEVASKLSITKKYLQKLYSSGCNTEAKLRQWKRSQGNKEDIIIYNTTNGELSLSEIIDKHHYVIDRVILLKRIDDYGEDSEAIWLPVNHVQFKRCLSEFGIEYVSHTSNYQVIRDVKFDRTNHCARVYGFRYTCEHYNDCQEYRLVNKTHHPRYVKDKCFVNSELEVNMTS